MSDPTCADNLVMTQPASEIYPQPRRVTAGQVANAAGAPVAPWTHDPAFVFSATGSECQDVSFDLPTTTEYVNVAPRTAIVTDGAVTQDGSR